MTGAAQDGARKETIMIDATINELRKKSEAARDRIVRQLDGMEAHLERSHAPGEWTTRQVLCHLLFEPGFRPAALLERFALRDLPLVEITPGLLIETPERRRMTLAGLLFEPRIGTGEVTLPIFVEAMFDRHWNGHADQLAQIRRAAGLPETK
jgi:hypothetical protein